MLCGPCCTGKADDAEITTQRFDEADKAKLVGVDESLAQQLAQAAEDKRIKDEEEAEALRAEKRKQEEDKALQAALEKQKADDALATAEAEKAPKAVVEEKKPFQDQMYDLYKSKMREPLEAIEGKLKRRPSSENITLQDYTAKHGSKFEAVLQLEKPDGWTFKTESEGVKVYQKSLKGNPLQYFKGQSLFKCEEGQLALLQSILKTEERPKWDETCMSGAAPQFYPPFYKYAHVQLKSQMGVISARDLVSIGRIRFEPDGAIVICLQSETLPEVPEQAGVVRINFIEGGYVIRPTANPSEFMVTWTGCVDPKGMIPVWVVNLVAKKQGLTLAKLKVYMNNQK